MRFADQVLSNDVLILTVRSLQQKLGTQLTKLTVFSPRSSHDEEHSTDLCVFVCVLPRYAFWTTTPIAELCKRTVQSTCCRSGDTQSDRACGCSSVLLAPLAQRSSSVMRRTNSSAARNLSRNEGRSTQVRRGDSNNSNRPHANTRTSVAEIVVATAALPPRRSSLFFLLLLLILPCLALPGRQLQRQVLQIASIHHVYTGQWRLCRRQEF